MLKILSSIFSSSDEKNEAFDPWIKTEVTEEKVRNLVRVRIRYIGNVVPNVPDLNTLLHEMAITKNQKESIKRIWQEEAEIYLSDESNKS